MIYTNLASMHQELNQVQEAVEILKESLERNILIYGKFNQKVKFLKILIILRLLTPIKHLLWVIMIFKIIREHKKIKRNVLIYSKG
jgi:hypothetical protein